MSAPILYPFDGAAFGGSVVSAFHLIRAGRDHGLNVLVPCHGDGVVAQSAREEGFAVLDMPPLAAPGRVAAGAGERLHLGNLTMFFTCYRMLRDLRPAGVHVNDLRMLRTWALPALAAGVPLVKHWRSGYRRSLSVGLGLLIARRIIAIARYNRDQLPAFARAKAEVIYNPFRCELDAQGVREARAEIRAANDIPQDAFLIGVFGSLSLRKRPHKIYDFVAALDRTADGRPVFGLMCGGPLEPADPLLPARQADPALVGRVRAPGHVRDVQRWMAACDAIIVPALREPFGRTGVEAQMLGIPIVLSTDSGLAELVEDGVTGFLVEPDDEAGWLDRLRRLADDPVFARRMGEAGRTAHDFSPESHYRQVLALYRQEGLVSAL